MAYITPSVDLIQFTPDAAKLIERIGRVCYKSEDKITEASSALFVKSLIGRGHESVLEHAFATAKFVTSRAISQQIMRHRIASYTQESTRYINYAKKGEFDWILPEGGDQWDQWNTDLQDCFIYTLAEAEDTYILAIANGVKPQIARDILPLCLKTEFYMTANLREWRHFFKMRCDKAAHPDVRFLAKSLLSQLYKVMPELLFDLEEYL